MKQVETSCPYLSLSLTKEEEEKEENAPHILSLKGP